MPMTTLASNVRYRRPPGLDGVEVLHCPDAGFRLAPHVHDTYVFWLNGVGADVVQLAGSSTVLQPDSFGVVAPGEVHANHAVTESRTLESIYVDEQVLSGVALQVGCRERMVGFSSRLQRDPQVRGALGRMHAILYGTDDPFCAQESLVSTFALMLDRYGESVSLRDVPSAPDKVLRARELMSEEFGAELDLHRVASECGCTPHHLIRLFRREIGMTPHAYLMEVRLCRARRLLASCSDISRAAMECGFTDQSHLTRRFKARYGVTPAIYRSQLHS